MDPLSIITALIASASSVTAIIRFLSNTSKKTEPTEQPYLSIQKNGQDADQEERSGRDVIHTIEAQLIQLNDYYNMNKRQANYSFNASVSAIILGFITIASGIWLFYLQKSLTLTAITGISGILAQFIGASYFIMYRTSITQVNYFFNQLVVMQDTMLTIELVRDLPTDGKPNETKQIELKEKIIFALLERSSSLERGSLTSSSDTNLVKTPSKSNKPSQHRNLRAQKTKTGNSNNHQAQLTNDNVELAGT